MFSRSPLMPLAKFNSNQSVSDERSFKRKWMLETTENSLDLLNSSNRRMTLTAKPARTPVSPAITRPTNQLMMIQEDIAGRLVKRIELVSQHEQIQLLLESITNRDTHRNYVRLNQCTDRLNKIKQQLFEASVSRKRWQEKLTNLELEREENQELLEAITRQTLNLQEEEKDRRAECQKKLIEFSQRNTLGKVTRDFLREFRQAPANKRETVRAQFVRFQKGMIPANRAAQVERITEQLRINYNKLAKEYADKYIALDEATQKIQNLLVQCLDQIKEVERELLSIKVNQEIGKSQLSDIKKQQESYIMTNQKTIQQRAAAIYEQYIQKQGDAFNNIEAKYGRQLRTKIAQQTRHKFYIMMKQQFENEVQDTTKMKERLDQLTKIIQYNTNQIQKALIPQARKIMNERNTQTFHPFRSEFIQIDDIKLNCQGPELPEDERRDSAYQFTQTSSIRKQDIRSLGKRSLDKKRYRMSVDDRPASTSKDLFKFKKESLRTEHIEKMKSDNTRCSTEQYHFLANRTISINASTPQLIPLIRQLSSNYVAVFKKSFSSAPTFSIQSSNLLQMGYSSRLLSLSQELSLEFRIGTRAERVPKNSKVDQTIPMQRIKKIEKVRAGMCFAVCLDKGVLDIVFKIEEQFQLWYNGLATLMRNRAIIGKVKGRI